MRTKVYAVILAGGIGTRLDPSSPKQLIRLGERSILEHSVEAFEINSLVDEIIIVINRESTQLTEKLVSKSNFKKVIAVMEGGTTRQISSCNGLSAIGNDESYVLIHDAARPLVSQELITNCINELEKYDAIVPLTEVTDTIAEINSDNTVKLIPDRGLLRKVQTPQGFKTSVIKEAHKLYLEHNMHDATDDCSMVIRFGLAKVHTIPGSEENIKITYPGDLQIAEGIYRLRKSPGNI